MQAIQLGIATLAPFGRKVSRKQRGSGFLATVFNVLWLVLFGWEIALVHLSFGLLLAITIIGLPFAQQHFKLTQLALFPFSYRLGGQSAEI
jgi:uncharacterized membrane protein YccF (DUF307 family)